MNETRVNNEAKSVKELQRFINYYAGTTASPTAPSIKLPIFTVVANLDGPVITSNARVYPYFIDDRTYALAHYNSCGHICCYFDLDDLYADITATLQKINLNDDEDDAGDYTGSAIDHIISGAMLLGDRGTAILEQLKNLASDYLTNNNPNEEDSAILEDCQTLVYGNKHKIFRHYTKIYEAITNIPFYHIYQ